MSQEETFNDFDAREIRILEAWFMCRNFHAILIVTLFTVNAMADPLPSWRDTTVKAAIIEYVAAITDPASPDFVPVPARIAVLDNDGTSWCERPGYGPTEFQKSLLHSMVAEGKADGNIMPISAWLADDREALKEFGWSQAYEAMNATFADMPVTAYRDSVRAWLDRTPHPVYNTPYTELYYEPMRELRKLLEKNDFKVWMVTGGAQDFVRAYLEPVFGIPPERVIGTWTTPVYSEGVDGVTMVRGSQQVYNGHQHKPAHIEMRIGRQPIFAAGNSNNDAPMCLWSISGEYRSLALWIHHDDAEREYDYDRGTDRIKRLVNDHPSAHEVSMARDWATIFKEH